MSSTTLSPRKVLPDLPTVAEAKASLMERAKKICWCGHNGAVHLTHFGTSCGEDGCLCAEMITVRQIVGPCPSCDGRGYLGEIGLIDNERCEACHSTGWKFEDVPHDDRQPTRTPPPQRQGTIGFFAGSDWKNDYHIDDYDR